MAERKSRKIPKADRHEFRNMNVTGPGRCHDSDKWYRRCALKDGHDGVHMSGDTDADGVWLPKRYWVRDLTSD